jgi:hypothetical protein
VTEKPSYLGAFWRHPYNRVALLAVGCMAILASIPFGWPGLALVGVLGLGAEALAALGIPELPSFKAWADRSHHHHVRAQRQQQLLTELANAGDAGALASYRQMCSRVEALYLSAGRPGTTLTREDVEKLQDLTVDYLGLCVVNLSLKQRKDSASEDVILKRIAALQTQLQAKALSADEERQLRSALAEYTEALKRSRRLAVRRSALEATLLAMPDKMEEVYQLVMTAPYASDMGGRLEESLARLRIAEEVAAEFGAAESPGLNAAWTANTAPTPASQAAQRAAKSLKS